MAYLIGVITCTILSIILFASSFLDFRFVQITPNDPTKLSELTNYRLIDDLNQPSALFSFIFSIILCLILLFLCFYLMRKEEKINRKLLFTLFFFAAYASLIMAISSQVYFNYFHEDINLYVDSIAAYRHTGAYNLLRAYNIMSWVLFALWFICLVLFVFLNFKLDTKKGRRFFSLSFPGEE